MFACLRKVALVTSHPIFFRNVAYFLYKVLLRCHLRYGRWGYCVVFVVVVVLVHLWNALLREAYSASSLWSSEEG